MADIIQINDTKREVVEMFGAPVNLYKFPYAGFLCSI